jgi:hypothetical protein
MSSVPGRAAINAIRDRLGDLTAAIRRGKRADDVGRSVVPTEIADDDEAAALLLLVEVRAGLIEVQQDLSRQRARAEAEGENARAVQVSQTAEDLRSVQATLDEAGSLLTDWLGAGRFAAQPIREEDDTAPRALAPMTIEECLRCGRNLTAAEGDIAAPSRMHATRDVPICSLCGELEFLRDFMGWPPIADWPLDPEELGREFATHCGLSQGAETPDDLYPETD